MVTQISHPSFIQNSMQIEKKKDLLEKLSALVKRGCWVFVIGKKLIDTALQLISGFTEFVNQGGKSEPIKKHGKN